MDSWREPAQASHSDGTTERLLNPLESRCPACIHHWQGRRRLGEVFCQPLPWRPRKPRRIPSVTMARNILRVEVATISDSGASSSVLLACCSAASVSLHNAHAALRNLCHLALATKRAHDEPTDPLRWPLSLARAYQQPDHRGILMDTRRTTT